MPECAEVATYADQLNKEYEDRRLDKIEIIGGRFLKDGITQSAIDQLSLPLNDLGMRSKGKFLWWGNREPGPDVQFFFHLGMSGSFGKKQKHSALRFEFENGEVFFNDPRHFGTFKINYGPEEITAKIEALGWDPLKEPNIPSNLLTDIRKYNHKKIGEFLMEQGPIVCGIGNYLRSELLFASKINPHRLISSLSDDEITIIFENAILIIQEAYKQGGASIKTYSDLYGIAGTFFNQFKVYGKKTDPNGFAVLKEKDKNGRTLHYVPEVQL